MSSDDELPDSIFESGEAGPPGDTQFLRLFEEQRERLRRIVELRLDVRVRGRLSASDVLQDVYLEASRSYEAYRRSPDAPFLLWLRTIAARKLLGLLRFHLGAQARDARLEVSIDRGMPHASSQALAARLVAQETSPSDAAQRGELRRRIEAALEQMEGLDREVLILRYFEQLSNEETAHVLGVQAAAASKRHVRALRRLRRVMGELPDSHAGPTRAGERDVGI